MEKTIKRLGVKVATETWIATALLHKENPDRTDFTVKEILERAQKEGIHGTLRPGVRVHAVLHCVANLPPIPGDTGCSSPLESRLAACFEKAIRTTELAKGG